MPRLVVSGISHRFRWLSRSEGQITHVLLTRSPLVYPRKGLTARLACVKHAASVRPEPGSNSPLKNNTTPTPPKQSQRRKRDALTGDTDKNRQNHCQRNHQPTNQTPTPKRHKESSQMSQRGITN